jgi:hypothetical protein
VVPLAPVVAAAVPVAPVVALAVRAVLVALAVADVVLVAPVVVLEVRAALVVVAVLAAPVVLVADAALVAPVVRAQGGRAVAGQAGLAPHRRAVAAARRATATPIVTIAPAARPTRIAPPITKTRAVALWGGLLSVALAPSVAAPCWNVPALSSSCPSS